MTTYEYLYSHCIYNVVMWRSVSLVHCVFQLPSHSLTFLCSLPLPHSHILGGRHLSHFTFGHLCSVLRSWKKTLYLRTRFWLYTFCALMTACFSACLQWTHFNYTCTSVCMFLSKMYCKPCRSSDFWASVFCSIMLAKKQKGKRESEKGKILWHYKE